MAQQQGVAQLLRTMADRIQEAPSRTAIAFTACGSELPVETLLLAAKQADSTVLPVIIGPKGIEGFPHYPADNLTDAHQIMQQLLDEGVVKGAVTLHFAFPLGTSTIALVKSQATGKQMVLASTTGTSDTQRIPAFIKNTISGIALAKSLGISEPTVGLLNLESISAIEKKLNRLIEAGYPLKWAESERADGGPLMRGNDLIRATPDVMVCDSLTGNLLIKLFSAGNSGGEMETVGAGYGVGLGSAQKYPICIISRASGPAVISESLAFCAKVAQANVVNYWQQEWNKAKACGVTQLMEEKAVASAQSTEADDNVAMPDKILVDEEIAGIDILELEDAQKVLWRANIYAESGMGCTGPVLMINHQHEAKARELLSQYLN